MATERSLLSSLSHPFLVSLLTAHSDRRHLYLLLELLPGGELWTVRTTPSRPQPCLTDYLVAPSALLAPLTRPLCLPGRVSTYTARERTPSSPAGPTAACHCRSDSQPGTTTPTLAGLMSSTLAWPPTGVWWAGGGVLCGPAVECAGPAARPPRHLSGPQAREPLPGPARLPQGKASRAGGAEERNQAQRPALLLPLRA